MGLSMAVTLSYASRRGRGTRKNALLLRPSPWPQLSIPQTKAMKASATTVEPTQRQWRQPRWARVHLPAP